MLKQAPGHYALYFDNHSDTFSKVLNDTSRHATAVLINISFSVKTYKRNCTNFPTKTRPTSKITFSRPDEIHRNF